MFGTSLRIRIRYPRVDSFVSTPNCLATIEKCAQLPWASSPPLQGHLQLRDSPQLGPNTSPNTAKTTFSILTSSFAFLSSMLIIASEIAL